MVSTTTQGDEAEQRRIMLGLLESVERGDAHSQRRLAADLGIALGLVNAYLKRCVTKGLVKVAEVPARRYAYYLTPQGFAEKSRLTVEYLSSSFSFFRQAKSDCAHVLQAARSRGFSRMVLAGVSDLAEIATICAVDAGVEIVAIVDESASVERYVGLPVVANFEAVEAPFEAVVVTDLLNTQKTVMLARRQFSPEQIFVPRLLGIRDVAGTGEVAS